MKIIEEILFKNQDLKYRDFNAKLIPNIDKDKIIGVRVPVIRKIANEIINEFYIDEFLNELPHKYHEENLLHAIILTLKYNDIDDLLNNLEKFLLFVDNWAVTDIISPKLFKKYPEKVYKKIKYWLSFNDEYVVRFAVVSLLQFYLDENFNEEILKTVSNIENDSFYVKMAISWFFSYALIKQYDKTIDYFENKKLDKWIHNKSLQKAIESFRISDVRKKYLKELKVK